ncbi:HAMP domain-containing protein [Roseomonas sp. JC162]|uniref:histidine kinase n=2 Tax=Neoroseomonas marina TaxID=1232220 RepID=A0A848E9E1_9PROT|nr:HAMP domain-containing protein [Neoroseomonas marina]
MAVQAAGLTIHALDRVDLQRFIQAREIAGRAFGAWRAAVLAPPERREQALADLDLPEGLTLSVDPQPIVRQGAPPPPPEIMRLFRLDLLGAGPQRLRPREVRLGPPDVPGGFNASLRLPDGEWLNIRVSLPPPRPWHSATFLAAFVVMTGAAALLILWAVARLMRPVRLLAAAADRLGRDVNAAPLEETGPEEVRTAAHAFNEMAARIRRFVADRTQMLAAIGHDLRTPITRLRLRAEFMDDDEQRRKMLADLDEMEQMIAATLAFARDDAAAEPASPIDLAALCRTVADEAADARPELAEAICYSGPERLVLRARPVALKRAIANLVTNALAYGGAARLTLSPPEGGVVRLAVDDDGPGIPEAEMENVFAPFRRLEGSRNRETGGTGLGLTITRNILRAHGGDVTLRNRPGGGLTVVASLPT